MIIYKINTTTFNRNTTCSYNFESVDGDRIALNHIPLHICELYYSSNADDMLSFVIYDMNTLEDYSFILLKESNLDDREGGVEILAIGYNCSESYRDLLSQLKFHVFCITENDEYKYQYIWTRDAILTEDEAITSEGRTSVMERGE
ncbi:MAG: hypothetical protein MJZ83_04990 [Bacteroidaceae bacterium]|nr:hypothetical protein [Bacteroidaceae bacterium]